MTDRRRARKAKQARRDVRRAKNRDRGDPLRYLLRRAMNRGHPLDLMAIASSIGTVDKARFEEFVNLLSCTRTREMTALLAVVTEVLIDDTSLRQRCHRELDARDDRLPRWIGALSQVDVYRAVHKADVLGDIDELFVGARIGGHELTLRVCINTFALSVITDAELSPGRIDLEVASAAKERPDDVFTEISVADARTWIENALKRPALTGRSERLLYSGAMVKWLLTRMPDGGAERSLTMYSGAADAACDEFFATDHAAPFSHEGHRELLENLVTGFQDPLRWSENRARAALRYPEYDGGGDDGMPLEVILDAPDLLRAFITYAHARVGIREDLTARMSAAR